MSRLQQSILFKLNEYPSIIKRHATVNIQSGEDQDFDERYNAQTLPVMAAMPGFVKVEDQ